AYRLVVTSLFEGTEKGTIQTLVSAELMAQGMFGASEQSAATDADITVTGIGTNIIRPTNVITDVIPGVTLNLQDLGTATISISDDVAATTAKVQEIIDAYNDIVAYIAENNRIQ